MPQHTHTQTQTWKPIPGYEGIYEASNHGNIRSLDRTTTTPNGGTRRFKGQNLKPFPYKTGHLQVKLSKGGKQETRWLHQLVLEAFVGPREPNQVVRHINDIPTDNRLENLTYGTQGDNIADAIRNGRNGFKNRTHCPHGHLLADPNLTEFHKKRGHRGCLSCARARSRIYRHPEWANAFNKLADSYYLQIMEQTDAK